MKNNTLKLIALALTSATSYSAQAINNGTPLDWNEHPYLIESSCTGTVLAGKYVILAGHCLNEYADLYNGEKLDVTSVNHELDSEETKYQDIAIWTLSDTVPMDKVLFTVDATNAEEPLQAGDEVYINGFGQLDKNPRLEMSVSVLDYYDRNFDLSKFLPSVGIEGHTVQGDSGAPVLNQNNELIGVHHSGSTDPDDGLHSQVATNLRVVKDWMLSGINSWHSVTEIKFTGYQTIDVQSLHVNSANLSESWNNGTLTTGDAAVIGGTCVTNGPIQPFGMCTLELASDGSQGAVILDDYEITINRVVKSEQPKESGGSLSFLSLFAMLSISLFRKIKK